MNYNHPSKNSSTIGIRMMCAIVFVVFSFCWLFFFQSDILMMAQHVLSGGLTHYNRTIGALLITVSLFIVQLVIYGFIHLRKRAHALTYLPSMLLLAMLSAIHPLGYAGVTVSFSWWMPLLIIICWIPMVLVARMAQEVEDDNSFQLLSRPMWINMLMMVLMMAGVAWGGNSNAVFHYRMQAERCLLDDDVDGALNVGKKSLESDADLLMIRMFALAKKDALGESLFGYPVTGTSEQMLPTDSQTVLMMYPTDSLYKFIGARPVERMKPMRYLELVQRRDTLPNKVINDYLLCGYLIDKDIDRFAAEVGKYYHINDSLPKHFREALTLYTHRRSNPIVVYHHTVMDEDYDNMQELERQYALPSERKGKVEEHYYGTYWYYYDYE